MHAKFREKAVFFSAFALWFIAGVILLKKGFFFLSPFEDVGVLGLLLLACLIGALKGKFVLGKKAKKNMAALRKLEVFDSLWKTFSSFYTLPFFLVLALMGFLGWQLTYWSVPLGVRGFIDVAVGVALLQGSFIYLMEGVVRNRYLN